VTDLQPYGFTETGSTHPRRPLSRVAIWSVWVGAFLVIGARLHFEFFVRPTSRKPDLTLVPYVLLAMLISAGTVVAGVIGAIRLRLNRENIPAGWFCAAMILAIGVPASIVVENWRWL
jgi:hypothetical protein